MIPADIWRKTSTSMKPQGPHKEDPVCKRAVYVYVDVNKQIHNIYIYVYIYMCVCIYVEIQVDMYLRASGSGRRPQRRMARLQISGHYAYPAVRSDLTPAPHFCPRATAAGSLH